MMKVAIWSSWPAAIFLFTAATAYPQQKPADSPAEQQAPAQAKPAELRPSAPDGEVAKNPNPRPVETDPAKLAQPSAAKPATNPDPSYVIGARDVLAIQIWGDPRLSGNILVRPDGRISMSLIGEINAAGLTPAELEVAIANLLKEKEILRKPQVTVQVAQILSKEYFLQGEVLKTGSFPLVVPTTILEALVNAGGFKDFANVKKIEIIRGKERFRFNYKDVIHGKHTEQNIVLKPGDIIIVP
jgi:polysaccharide biosynthesis/export protein